MKSIFPKPIQALTKAQVNLEGANLYLVNGEEEQVVFMEFEKDVEISLHSHESQWEIVLEGKVDYFEMELNTIIKKVIGFSFQKESYILPKYMQGILVLLFLIKKIDIKRKISVIYFLFFIL